jgi:hypothetical protein
MDKCTWKSESDKCPRPKLANSDYCLFHKPNKDQIESTLFWEVLNIDYFKYLDTKTLRLIRLHASYDQATLKEYPELSLLLSTGIIQTNFNQEITKLLGESIKKARATFVTSCNNPVLGSQILRFYDDSLIHGYDSGFFIGFVFPQTNYVFNYKINPKGLVNGRNFSFSECVFEGAAIFENYNFREYDVQFKNCEFKQQISFYRSTFNHCLKFENSNLDTRNWMPKTTPFQEATINGAFVSFEGGSICSLFGIRVSEFTDIIIEEDVIIANEDRPVGDWSQFRNHYNDILFIAKRQAERTGNVSLINRYEENLKKFKFNYFELHDDLIEISAVLQKRRQYIQHEDEWNDFVKDALGFKGYRVLDQTRGGHSGAGINAGELDIEVCNNYGNPFSILEGLKVNKLGKADKAYIVLHIDKLIHKYDTSGHQKNFILVYCSNENFDKFFKDYQDFILTGLNTHPDFSGNFYIKKATEIASPMADIRLLDCEHNRNNKGVNITHIVIKAN